MKSEAARDDQTVVIASALGIFVMVMMVGIGALAAVAVVADAPADVQRTIFLATLVTAVLLTVRYLVAQRRARG